MRRPRRSSAEAPIVLVTFPDFDNDHPQHGGALTAAGYVSDDGSCITGTTIHIDGGVTARRAG